MDDVLHRDVPRTHAIDWRAMVLGAGLVVLFGFLFSLLGAALRSVVWTGIFSAVAYFLAGLVTTWVFPASPPRAPAIGGTIVLAFLGAIQLIVMRDQLRDIPAHWLVLGWILSVAVAFALLWAGALVGARISQRRVRSRRMSSEPPAPPPGQPEIRPV